MIAVFAMPVSGFIGHISGVGASDAWVGVGFAVEVGATLFFLLDLAVGFAARGRAYGTTSTCAINVLACASVAIELLVGQFGLANPRILQVLRAVRVVAKAGLLVRGGATDSVLGAEALKRLNEQDAWYVLALLLLLSALGQFSVGVYDGWPDAAVEIAVYLGFFLAVRWKARRNIREIDAVFIGRLRDANGRVLERMQEIPGLEDAEAIVKDHTAQLAKDGKPASEIEVMVIAIGMIVGNLRRFISRRTFAEAKGDVVLPPNRPVALMFTDVEGFSRITESMRQDVIPVLKWYLGDMSQGVAEYRGDVDKFIGDAVFAYFQDAAAPDNAANLCFDATIQLDRHCRLLGEANAEWGALFGGNQEWDAFKHFRTRFGLHFGYVVAGPIGNENRADSTLIGDDVNISARLEALSKKYRSYTLLSEEFFDRLSADRKAFCRRIDRVTVAGRENRPFNLYTIEEVRKPDDYYMRYDEALDLYLRGEWQSAHGRFRAAQDVLTNAGAAPCPIVTAMMERIEANRSFWFRAVDHMHARAPDVVDEALKARLIATRETLPFIAPSDWQGHWPHEK
ncbi:MAG: adenylate/guanylate cyclase domain-containing protein [Pseudomonadota bacterium]